MPDIFIGLIVLVVIVYSVSTLLSYFNTASALSDKLQAVCLRVDLAQQKFSEHEVRIKSLKGKMPNQRSRCTRLRQWSVLLTQQLVRLESEPNQQKVPDEEKREKAIQDARYTARTQWLGE